MSINISSHRNSLRSILKSTSIISVGTLTSRILGFIRDVILAKLLGTAARADAFFVAFRIPNLFRDLVGEGAANSAFVPVIADYQDKKKQELWDFVSVIFGLSLIFLSVITITGIVLAPVIVRLIAPGFIAEPEKLHLTVKLTRIMFPYLILIGLTAYSTGVLYTFRSFTAPAFAPCMLNIAIIVTALFVSQGMEEPVVGLAFGVLIGGFLQVFVQIGPLFKTGLRFTRPKTLNHPGARKVGKLLIPRIFGAGVYQMTVFIDTFCASLAAVVGMGGISAIYYANRIIQFPMGIFGLALASAALPTMSDLAAKNDITSFKRTLIFSLKNIFFVMFPTSIVLMILAEPLIRVLFERGQFDQYSTSITSWALLFYAIGLFSFGGIKILVTAFHALQDTKTPVKVAAFCLVVNATLNILLMWPLKVGGIALASAIAATLDFLILFFIMDRRLGGLKAGLFRYLFKMFFATAVVGGLIVFMWINFDFFNELIRLIVVGAFGFIIFIALSLLLKVEQAVKIAGWIRRKNQGR